MTQMNHDEARHNMIEQQIRTWGVLDQTVLDLLAQVPREDFVPAAYRNLAFSDLSIPLGNGEVMMPPRVEARLLQALAIKPHETVLEIGTGSGYFTALLAKLARHVFSVEIQAEFLASARKVLEEHDIYNVSLELGDAARGWDRHAPYDVIVVTGSLPILPESCKTQLKVGGRLAVANRYIV
jgi:protein-L-isoaspartate(D-aspartate) O-methyltransferase